jgi:hypothetical protein
MNSLRNLQIEGARGAVHVVDHEPIFGVTSVQAAVDH